jgi:hypothetical protein
MIFERFQKSIFITIVLLSLFLIIFSIFNPLYSENNKNFQFKKNPEIQNIKPKKPVKIKLKRTTSGKYTWDLTGDDVDEIVRADKRLRKLLNTE